MISKDQRNFLHQVRKPFGSYSFITFDTCPIPGLKWPLNLAGIVRDDTWEAANRLSQQAKDSKQTFWIGHYPLSVLVPSSRNVHKLIGENSGFAYLTGHLHTAGGLIPRMYARHAENFWEWELGDWKDNRHFRLMAVDNNLVSFIDYRLPEAQWSLLLITNPKDARFLLPGKEPVDWIELSSEIRILAWSPNSPITVSVVIDGVPIGETEQAVDSRGRPSPLFVLSWSAKRWKDKLIHLISVTAIDSKGNKRTIEQPFVVGTPAPPFSSFLANLALLINHAQVMQIVFYSAWTFTLLLFIIARILIFFDLYRKLCCSCCRGLENISASNRTLIPILIYLIYMACCPLYLGIFSGQSLGVAFSFGSTSGLHFNRDSRTYFFEMIQLILFWSIMPIVLIYYAKVSKGFEHLVSNRSSIYHVNQRSILAVYKSMATRFRLIPWGLLASLIVFSLLQLTFTLLYVWLPFGVIGVLFSPGRILPLILFWYLSFNLSLD